MRRNGRAYCELSTLCRRLTLPVTLAAEAGWVAKLQVPLTSIIASAEAAVRLQLPGRSPGVVGQS